MYCEKCGFKLSEDTNFCEKCGNRVSEVSNEYMAVTASQNDFSNESKDNFGNGFSSNTYTQQNDLYSQNTKYAPQNTLSTNEYYRKKRDFFFNTKDSQTIKLRKALSALSVVILVICVLEIVQVIYDFYVSVAFISTVSSSSSINVSGVDEALFAAKLQLIISFIHAAIHTILIAFGNYCKHHGFYIAVALLSLRHLSGLSSHTKPITFLFIIVFYAIIISALVISLKLNKKYKTAQLNRRQ